MDLGFLHELAEDLAPVLAPLLTKALSDPPPTLLRGETVLLPKGSATSADPGDYRPITLLPALSRILARLVDRILRAAAATDPDITLCHAQAGFMPGRSCHEQAFLFHVFQGDAQARRTELHGVLLDLAKAFDSLDHGQLLDIMVEIGFKPPHVELVRRMLLHSITQIGPHRIDLARGAPQGSPFSPFLAVIYFESLARVIRAYVLEHPEGVPPTLKMAGDGQQLVLSALLLYADDTTLLGTSVEWLQGLLDALTGWASRRLMVFNAKKSQSLHLSKGRGSARGPHAEAVTIQGQRIPQVNETKLLGCPVRAATRHASYAPFSPDLRALGLTIHRLRKLFTLRAPRRSRPGTIVLDFNVLRQGIIRLALPTISFAMPVVKLDYAAIDSRLRRHLRSMLGLPTTFPSVALHWLLRLWPIRFSAALARLKLAWRVYHQYWYGHFIRGLVACRTRTPRGLLANGPLGALTALLRDYGIAWPLLDHSDYTPTDSTPEARDHAYCAWSKMCQAKVADAFAAWVIKALGEKRMPPDLRMHFPSTVAQVQQQYRAGLPFFLQAGGDYARAGLRLLAPRIGSPGGPTQECVLCGAASVSPMHILACEGLPVGLKDCRSQSLSIAVGARSRALADWPEGQEAALLDYLWFIGQALDVYAAAANRAGAKIPLVGLSYHARFVLAGTTPTATPDG
jgi:hypothetical protein